MHRHSVVDARGRATVVALTALVGALALGACAWVQLSEEGRGVRVAAPGEVAACEKLGATHAKTSTQAGIFTRSDRKVDQELEFLARNEAAEMGGDTVVPQGPTSSEGRRSYDVLRCGG